MTKTNTFRISAKTMLPLLASIGFLFPLSVFISQVPNEPAIGPSIRVIERHSGDYSNEVHTQWFPRDRTLSGRWSGNLVKHVFAISNAVPGVYYLQIKPENITDPVNRTNGWDNQQWMDITGPITNSVSSFLVTNLVPLSFQSCYFRFRILTEAATLNNE